MNKTLLRTVSVLMAILMTFSVLSYSATAAELDTEEDEALAGVGAAAPVITSLEPCNEGMKLSWKASSGVPYYRVYRWYDDGRGWVKLKDTDQLYCIDSNVTSGKTYEYRLVGINAAGSIITSTSTKSAVYYAPVQVTDTQVMSDGIQVYWTKDAAVGRVALFRKTNGGSWQCIARSPNSSYLDKYADYGVEYRYTVRGLNDDGSYINDYYDDTGVSVRRLETPSLRAESALGGVKISWNAVEGAENYRIFYRSSSGWSRLATTSDTSFLDDDVRSGNSYIYTVRCVSADGERYTSFFDTSGKAVTYIAAPVLLSADGTNDGIRISWQASVGAAKYRVFYRNSRGGWSHLGDTTGTSILDDYVASGVTYTYTVRCMNSSGEYISGYDDNGVSGMYVSAPVFSVSNGADGVDISWNAVPGAVNYRVYYYGSRGWTRLTDTTATSFTDTDVRSDVTYTYTVRCINAEGTEFTSGFLSGRSTHYIAAPKITGISSTEEGVKISWGSVAGAQKYRLYYRTDNGWKKITDTTATSYIDTNVSSGGAYTYTLRCINAAGDAFQSYFKPGVTHEFVSAPVFRLTRNDNSITVSWDKVDGAALYRVYRRGENGWVRQADVTDTSYEDKNVISGSTYTYTVRCLNAEATAFTSDYRSGKSMRIVDMPVITSVENTTEGVEIQWSSSLGASVYRVYMKSSSGWTKIGETYEPKFIHDAESGKDYTYTVRCVNLAGTEFESNFDPVGKSIHYIASPKNIKAESYSNSIRISWTHSPGAAKYRIYYYGSRGWTRMVETTDNEYIDSDVESGKTYRYTVRCISADSQSFTSDCDTTGAVCKFTIMPVLRKPEATKDGIKISWDRSPGAEKYRVYNYGSRGWTKIVETTDTSFEYIGVDSGENYRFTVRCITADGRSFTSDCDTTGVSIYYVAAPRMISADTGYSGATITWNQPRGAVLYRVYKRVNGSWRRLTDTTSNSYTDSDAEVGETYTYTVRVLSEDSSSFLSNFDPDGFIVTVIASSPSTSGFVYYDQGDYNYPYGDDTIAYSGCGPTCFAMVASTLLRKTITPIDAVKWCGNSYYMYGVGTYWSYYQAASDHFGIRMEKQIGKDDTLSVVAALKQGKYVISAQSAGRFTRGGHFIVLAGITSTGRIIVYDPNGGNHYVGVDFALSEVTESGTQYWVFSNK